MSGPLLVVDAPSMLFRAFYALPDTINGRDGQPVNALLGTANLVLREVEEHSPRAVVLCFGPDAADYRVELFDGYHAERPEVPDTLAPQFADSRDFFEAFGWTVAERDLEADDLLGSFAGEARPAGSARDDRRPGHVPVRRGPGHDPLRADGRARRRAGGSGRGAQALRGAPELVPDFIALRGDPSDGIPGAKGIGEKTAADLLARHGSLEAALDAAMRETRPGCALR